MRNLCRLCSSTEKIIDVYHPKLGSGEQLRHYILLACGIEILRNDPISRMVCHRCCEIAVKLHQYRSNAVANDKLLKEKYGQPYTAPITDKDELLSAASKIFNLTETGIMKDDVDPLDLLNTYITSKNARNGKGHVTKANVQNVRKTDENVFSNQTRGNTLDSVRYKSTSALENDKAADSLHNVTNDVPKAQSVVKCDIPKAPSIMSNVDTARVSQSDIHTDAHPSVKELFKQFHSIQLPKEVISSHISPSVAIDPTEVSDWYTQQLQTLKDKLKHITSSNSNSQSSSDDEAVFRPRKRKHKRIIACSDSDDDDVCLPRKAQAQDVTDTQPARIAPEIPNCSNVTSDSKVDRSNPTKPPGGGGYKLKIMKHLPPPTATNKPPKDFLATEPNARVLESLLSSNDQTLANLYTDFSKYGINIENSEPPIRYANDGESANSLTDIVVEAIVGQKHQTIKPVNVNKVNDDIICISDDDNDDVVELTTANSEISEEKMIDSLLKKHLNSRAQETQTFHPNDSIIHRTKTNLIALPNMVDELRRYKIPIDLRYSVGNVAHFENYIIHYPRPILDKWSIEECKNISLIKSIKPCKTPTATVLNSALTVNTGRSKLLSSSIWNQAFVNHINNAIKNKGTENNGKVVPPLAQQVTPSTPQPSHTTPKFLGTAVYDNNVTVVNAPCVDTEANRQQPIILNGSNSLSLRSLLFPERITFDRTLQPDFSNKSTGAPLLQNYLQTNTTPSKCKVYQTAKNLNQVDNTSKIRVKNMAELL